MLTDKLADVCSLLQMIAVAADAIADDRADEPRETAGHIRDTAHHVSAMVAETISEVAALGRPPLADRDALQ